MSTILYICESTDLTSPPSYVVEHDGEIYDVTVSLVRGTDRNYLEYTVYEAGTDKILNPELQITKQILYPIYKIFE